MLPFDLKWNIVQHLPAIEIVRLRVLSREWCMCVDRISQEEWKHLYATQVCDALNVSASFDWKVAAIVTSRHVDAVEAVCTWNMKRVRVAVPWCTSGLDPLLRSDVRRASSTPVTIDYEYNCMFLLRAFLRTCRYRTNTVCANCQSKQRCLSPHYDYFIRLLSDTPDTTRDEHLGHLLAINPQSSLLKEACSHP